MCCWDRAFTTRAVKRVADLSTKGTPAFRQALTSFKDLSFLTVLESLAGDWGPTHSMANELDHSLLRTILKGMKHGKRPPRVMNVFGRHYCRKVKHELHKWRVRNNIKVAQAQRRKATTNSILCAEHQALAEVCLGQEDTTIVSSWSDEKPEAAICQ